MGTPGAARGTLRFLPQGAAWLRVTFRFYAGLNRFLPPQRRQRDFTVPCAIAAATGHMLEALGVPPAEVTLILVNGQPVGFDHRLADGDRVSVYPAFEIFDLGPLRRT